MSQLESTIVSRRIDVRLMLGEPRRPPRNYNLAYQDLNPRRGDIAAALKIWAQEVNSLGLGTLAGCLVPQNEQGELHA